MNTYTVYTRSSIAYAVFYFVYLTLHLFVFAVISDYLPDYLETVVVLLYLLTLPFVPHFLAQLSSRVKLTLQPMDDRLILSVVRYNYFMSYPPPLIYYRDIADTSIKGNIVTGNYLEILLTDSTKLKLWQKPHLVGRNPSFFNMLHELKNKLYSYKNDSDSNTGATIESNNTQVVAINRKVLAVVVIGIRLFFLWGVLGVLLMLAFLVDEESNIVLAVISIAAFAYGYIVFRKFGKQTAYIVADSEAISFNGQTYQWKDLQTPVNGMAYSYIHSDGIRLLFKNGVERKLSDKKYKNLKDLKTFLTNNVASPELIEDWTATTYPNNVAESEDLNYLKDPEYNPSLPQYNKPEVKLAYENVAYFKGDQFLSTTGIALWVCVLLVPLIAIWVFHDTYFGIALSVTLPFLLFFALRRNFNYFGISDKYFIVRNHNLFWRTNAYLIADIDKIVLTSYDVREGVTLKMLTIVFANHRAEQYVGASLLTKHWLSLKQALERKGIAIRDDVGYDRPPKTVSKKRRQRLYWGLSIFLITTISLSIYIAYLPTDTAMQVLVKFVWVLGSLSGVILLLMGILWWASGADNDNKTTT